MNLHYIIRKGYLRFSLAEFANDYSQAANLISGAPDSSFWWNICSKDLKWPQTFIINCKKVFFGEESHLKLLQHGEITQFCFQMDKNVILHCR